MKLKKRQYRELMVMLKMQYEIIEKHCLEHIVTQETPYVEQDIQRVLNYLISAHDQLEELLEAPQEEESGGCDTSGFYSGVCIKETNGCTKNHQLSTYAEDLQKENVELINYAKTLRDELSVAAFDIACDIKKEIYYKNIRDAIDIPRPKCMG